MEKVQLSHPIMVNGKELSVLECDMDSITVDDFIEADTKARAKRGGTIATIEFDPVMHIYLAFMGIVRAMPEVDVSDLERISGSDVMRVGAIGRFFTLTSAAEESSQSSSEEPSDGTQKNSQPA